MDAFIQSSTGDHHTFSMGIEPLEVPCWSRQLQRHWLTDVLVVQADGQTDRGWVSDGCTASHALMLSCQISLTENQ